MASSGGAHHRPVSGQRGAGCTVSGLKFVAGQVVQRCVQLEALDGRYVIDSCVNGLIRVLVNLHRINSNAVGLSNFGKFSEYLEHQGRR